MDGVSAALSLAAVFGGTYRAIPQLADFLDMLESSATWLDTPMRTVKDKSAGSIDGLPCMARSAGPTLAQRVGICIEA